MRQEVESPIFAAEWLQIVLLECAQELPGRVPPDGELPLLEFTPPQTALEQAQEPDGAAPLTQREQRFLQHEVIGVAIRHREQDEAVRRRHSRQLGQHSSVVMEVFDDPQARCGIEAACREGQPLHIRLQELPAESGNTLSCLPAGERQHLRGNVDPDVLDGLAAQNLQENARPTSRIQEPE